MLLALAANALADPQITSWLTLNSAKFAQIYRTDAEKISGSPETTWGNGRNAQSQPAFCAVQQILPPTSFVNQANASLTAAVQPGKTTTLTWKTDGGGNYRAETK